MPRKEKTAKKVEEERFPKHVTLRLSYRDYLKLVEIGNVAGKMKESKDVKKIISSIVGDLDEELNADKFLGLITNLPAKGEKSIERFYSQVPRGPPTKMYFTDPERATNEVNELHNASRKWTKEKGLRYDQAKETCPTDVRVMFYAYVRGKGLIEDDTKEIAIDKFLKKIAPKTLSGVKHIKRNNSSLIWEICSEIRGVKPKKKAKVEIEDESEEEIPKKKGRKKVVETEDESEEEEESSEEEIFVKSKPKRR
jgi:hypothetical protein